MKSFRSHEVKNVGTCLTQSSFRCLTERPNSVVNLGHWIPPFDFHAVVAVASTRFLNLRGLLRVNSALSVVWRETRTTRLPQRGLRARSSRHRATQDPDEGCTHVFVGAFTRSGHVHTSPSLCDYSAIVLLLRRISQTDRGLNKFDLLKLQK